MSYTFILTPLRIACCGAKGLAKVKRLWPNLSLVLRVAGMTETNLFKISYSRGITP